jgi:uncharacterized DUF497 family protein
VKLIIDSEAEAWLSMAPEFEWDAGNRGKMAKHGNSPDDVETIYGNPIVLAGRIIEPVHTELRWLALGKLASNKSVALIFTRRRDRVRPISCRPMRKNERRIYDTRTQE